MYKHFLVGIAVLLAYSMASRSAYGQEVQSDIVKRLIEIAEKPGENPAARTAAIDMLGGIKPPDEVAVVDALVGLLNKPNVEEQKAKGADDKPKQEDQKGKADLQAVKKLLKHHSAVALGKLGSAAAKALPDLVAAKGYDPDFNKVIGEAVANILKALTKPASTEVPQVLKDLAGNDVSKKLAAAKSLREIPTGATAAQVLTALFKSMKSATEDVDVRRIAADSAIKVIEINKGAAKGDDLTKWYAEFVDGLATMLDDKNDTLRLRAAQMCADLGTNAKSVPIALLKIATNDKNAQIKCAAENAVLSIQGGQKIQNAQK